VIRLAHLLLSSNDAVVISVRCDKDVALIKCHLVMVALCNRADHYIFLPCDFYLLSSIFFFPRLISAAAG